ncbi:MAG: hypothetical protein L7F78_09570, partial [Syntrophales bacterium LBB04]|nr:hypothetical protein [Syntrophales bacterium LBB04]
GNLLELFLPFIKGQEFFKRHARGDGARPLALYLADQRAGALTCMLLSAHDILLASRMPEKPAQEMLPIC